MREVIGTRAQRLRTIFTQPRRRPAETPAMSNKEPLATAKPAPHPTHHDPTSDRAPHQPPTPAQADALAAGATAWRLTAPPTIQLGETVVGRRLHASTSIFALDAGQQGPRVVAKLSGDPAIQLVRAPLFLPSASQPYDPQNELELEVLPTHKGVVTAELELVITDAPVQSFRIPVRAAAHELGEPTLAEQDAEAAARANQAAKERDAAAVTTRVEHAIHDDQQRDIHYHSGHLQQLDDARMRTLLELNAVYEHRHAGVDAASVTVGEFHRRTPAPERPSLLEDLAWLAIDVATAGLAGGIAKSAELLLSRTTTMPTVGFNLPRGPIPAHERTPSKALVAFATDAVKDVTKRGGAAFKKGMHGGGEGRSATHAAGLSIGAKADFFRLQQDQLVDENAARAVHVATTLHHSLLPVLRADPALAVAQLNAVADAFAAQKPVASTLHEQQGIEKWVRYVAETSGADHADAPFDENHPHGAYDGLIDIMIQPDPFHPELPVPVTGARLTGVTKDVVDQIKIRQLNTLGLTVRAAGDFNSPTSTLTVLRRADASVTYAHTEGGEERGWLERKAAAHGRGPDALWGARILLEQELMTQTLSALVNDKVETDSE